MTEKREEVLTLRIVLEDFGKLIADLPYYIYLFLCALLESITTYFSPGRRTDLESESILVTGAATGLGRSVVLQIAKKYKPTLVLWDINEGELQKTVKACKELGAKVYSYVVDLSNHQEIIETAEKVRQEVGCITVLYNNAGIAHVSPFDEANVALEEKVIQVNLMSYIWTIREFLPGMIERGRGQVVSTCSGIAFLRYRYIASYAASKYGLRGYIETLKLDMRIHPKKPDIRFSTVYPAWMKTAMTTGVSWKPRYHTGILLLMDCEYAAGKIVHGIVNNEEDIIIPQFLKVLAILYWFLPTKFFDDMERYLFQDIKVVDTEHTTNLLTKAYALAGDDHILEGKNAKANNNSD